MGFFNNWQQQGQPQQMPLQGAQGVQGWQGQQMPQQGGWGQGGHFGGMMELLGQIPGMQNAGPPGMQQHGGFFNHMNRWGR